MYLSPFDIKSGYFFELFVRTSDSHCAFTRKKKSRVVSIAHAHSDISALWPEQNQVVLLEYRANLAQ